MISTEWPDRIENVEQLEELLSRPDEGVAETIRQLSGDFLILGVGGKMGPTLARMARRALTEAGKNGRVIGVARFSSPGVRDGLEQAGVETVACDLLNRDELKKLPDAENVVFMAGKKFGSTGGEWDTWAMNAFLPGMTAERFCRSRIVVFSTGNVYPLVSVDSGGAREDGALGPIGEYAQSCLGRERIFEYFSRRNNTPCLFFRLNYAVETRYGILLDIAQKIVNRQPISLAMGYVNLIWQGDANAMALRSLAYCSSPPDVLNVTGRETLSVQSLARQLGERLGEAPILEGTEEPTALLSNSSKAIERFGAPRVRIEKVMDWVADWVRKGGPTLDKPTKFEVRSGKF